MGNEPGVGALAWLLADSRLPSGAHAHSGGVEQAVDEGSVTDISSLSAFLEGRLATAVAVGATVAAAAALAAREHAGPGRWQALEDAADARTPSRAMRLVSRRQGEAFLRVGQEILASEALITLGSVTDRPHLAVASGAVCGAAGLGSADAASVFAHGSCAQAASAALRLLGLDPMSVTLVLRDLAPSVDELAERAAREVEGPLRSLEAASAPLLDLLAETHAGRRERLFAS
jgi:urease accessory protein